MTYIKLLIPDGGSTLKRVKRAPLIDVSCLAHYFGLAGEAEVKSFKKKVRWSQRQLAKNIHFQQLDEPLVSAVKIVNNKIDALINNTRKSVVWRLEKFSDFFTRLSMYILLRIIISYV